MIVQDQGAHKHYHINGFDKDQTGSKTESTQASISTWLFKCSTHLPLKKKVHYISVNDYQIKCATPAG
jgi:hypothetical protein